MDVITYHNPECGTSRNTLAMIRNAGIERMSSTVRSSSSPKA